MSDSTPTDDQTVLVLFPPRLPLATSPVARAHYGVPIHSYDLIPMGCKVEVDPYQGQQAGDTVSINLNGETALDSQQTTGTNDTVTLHIPHQKLMPGVVNRLTYTVTRASTNLDTSEPPLEILYHRIRPGNEDLTPGDREHSELVLLLPDEIKNGVGPGFTGATVCVEYPYCRAHDVIRLNCNGNDVRYVVTETQAPAPPDHGSSVPTRVCFDITSTDLGPDHPEFKFSFTVNDQLNNSPDLDSPWSAVQTVDVDQAGARLPEPIPREILSEANDDPHVIDLEKLGSNSLSVIILTSDPRFVAGDTIEATYIAKIAGQQNIEFTVTGIVELDELGQKKACILLVPNDKVIPDSTVQISYKLSRNGAPVGSSRTATATVVGTAPGQLPTPLIDEAAGDHLDPSNVPSTGATVRIDASAQLKANDNGEVHWMGAAGAGSRTVPFSVAASEEGQDKTVKVPFSVVEANEGRTITLTYTLNRAAGGPPEDSPPSIYDVGRQVGPGALLVMGARSAFFRHWSSMDIRQLAALDPTTLQPRLALWSYEGDSGSVNATHFPDTQPSRMLLVRSGDDSIRINPINVFSNGNDRETDHPLPFSAFAARRDRGTLIGWGRIENGSDIPPTIRTFTDIVEVAGSAFAFAALRANGHVVAWGDPTNGGDLPASIAPYNDIVGVSANASAFAARRSNGNLLVWGSGRYGGVVPDEIASLGDIVEVTGNHAAFAARRANGHVVAWGVSTAGGSVPSDISALNDIDHIVSSAAAFAALRTNGRVAAWGYPTGGGSVPGAITILDDITYITSTQVDANADATQGTFAALRQNGHVVAWGNPALGGTVPGDIAELSDIRQISSTLGAYAVLRASGHVAAWGHTTYGAVVPADIIGINDIVQVTSTQGAFAALRANGTVVAWGLAAWGGDTAAVASQLHDVRAVYANNQAFTALTTDGRVVTWGLAGAGGNSDAVQGQLQGQVSYEATPISRGVAQTTFAAFQDGA
ncbi:hypothetical protein J3P80_17785 [Pseudomonas sp. D2-30]|uniref:hypothetical protein n=1 Tax=unclassified Pseudomonas TaxID=196821 RepID=UPI003DA876EB